jgi:hypothetical protein
MGTSAASALTAAAGPQARSLRPEAGKGRIARCPQPALPQIKPLPISSRRQGAVKPTALKPRDPNLTAAVLRSRATSTSQKKTGSSLSSLLQSRSEAAAAKRAAAPVTPLSPLPDIDSKDKTDPLAAAEYAQVRAGPRLASGQQPLKLPDPPRTQARVTTRAAHGPIARACPAPSRPCATALRAPPRAAPLQDIYCYYRRVEPRFAVPADYMKGQVRTAAR